MTSEIRFTDAARTMRENATLGAAFGEQLDRHAQMLSRGHAFAREREARQLIVAALPRGFGWLVEHPRAVRAYFSLRPSKRPVLVERR